MTAGKYCKAITDRLSIWSSNFKESIRPPHVAVMMEFVINAQRW